MRQKILSDEFSRDPDEDDGSMSNITEKNTKKLINLLQEEELSGVVQWMKFDEMMQSHTSMRVGGPARIFAEPSNSRELDGLLRFSEELGIATYVIGNGSNIVVSDEGIDGLVVCLGERFSEIKTECPDNTPETIYISVQAGALLSGVAKKMAKEGWSGMEFAAGIPGSIGGAVFMNAGAYGTEMSDIVVSVRSVDDDLCLHEYQKNNLDFGYRESRFSQKGGIVLSTGLILKKDDSQKILARIAELNKKRTACQPLNMPSAGSVFKRPVGQYAGALIEAAGMKGYSIGGAQVSEKHAGFIVNTGEATAGEIYALMQHVIATVREHSGVTLESEIKFIGKGFEE